MCLCVRVLLTSKTFLISAQLGTYRMSVPLVTHADKGVITLLLSVGHKLSHRIIPRRSQRGLTPSGNSPSYTRLRERFNMEIPSIGIGPQRSPRHDKAVVHALKNKANTSLGFNGMLPAARRSPADLI